MSRFKELLDSELPPKVRSQFPRILSHGYKQRDEIVSSNPIFRLPSAPQMIGHLTLLAVEYAIAMAAREGVLDVDVAWSDFGEPTGKSLVMRTRMCDVTVSQLQHQSKFPRHAMFREENAAENPQPEFWPVPTKDSSRRYLILGHGYQSLHFAFLGLPHPSANCWIEKTGNLLNEIHQVATDLPPVEQARGGLDLDIREDVLRRLRDEQKG